MFVITRRTTQKIEKTQKAKRLKNLMFFGLYLALVSLAGSLWIQGVQITSAASGPGLISAMAKNTGGTEALETGDSIEFVFNKPTTKLHINAGNVNSIFKLNNNHSFLDGMGSIENGTWSEDAHTFTLTLSARGAAPTVSLGDTVTIQTNSDINGSDGLPAYGSFVIIGSFGSRSSGATGGSGNPSKNTEFIASCSNGIVNGKIYKLPSSPTVYLAQSCELRPFRGVGAFKARGLKFQDVITLKSFPDGAISEKPAQPSAGTLVKGSDSTIYFVTADGTKRGFVSGKHFTALGFKYSSAHIISGSDLELIPTIKPIEPTENHPDGTLYACGNSQTVFQVVGGSQYPFASGESFSRRGYSFTNVVRVPCGKYIYKLGDEIK